MAKQGTRSVTPVDRAAAAFHAGDFEGARALLGRYARHHAQDARALHILGAASNALHEYGAAEAQTRAALAAWEGEIPASLHNNLGLSVAAQGRIAEALGSLVDAVRLSPNSRDFRANLALALHAAGRRTDAASVALGAPGAPENMVAAILAYEDGDLDECRRVLDLVRPGFEAGLADGMDPRQWHNLNVYRAYLGELLAYRAVHEVRYPRGEDAAELPSLYVIGDSHALAPAGMRVVFLGAAWRVVPLVVIGAKAWHLASSADGTATNRYARAFQIALDRVPAGATVVSLLGEIDCRADEGIVPHAQRHPEVSVDAGIADLVRGYAGFLDIEAARRDLTIHLGGVPAPRRQAIAGVPVDTALFVAVVRMFNEMLAVVADASGIALLDTYRATVGSDGFATGGRHLDTHHLLPEVFAQAGRAAQLAPGAIAERAAA